MERESRQLGGAMAVKHGIFLHEAMLLLVLHDDRGTASLAAPTSTALGAGVLGELLLRGRVGAEKTRFSTLVTPLGSAQVGDQVIDEMFERIRTAKRRASIATWISRIGHSRGLLHRVARRLCVKGVLRADEKQVLLLFTRRIYPQVNPAPERALIGRLRAVALGEAPADAPSAMALGIARHTTLLYGVLDRAERKRTKKQLAAIVGSFPEAKLIDDAVKSAVESSAAAATTSTIIVGAT